MQEEVGRIRKMKTVVVASGKGGVGKSTVAFLLAQALAEEARVLLLDFDLCGPSVGVLTGNIEEKVVKGEKGLVPLKHSANLFYLSISSMVQRDTAVIWRAPKKIALLTLFMESADPHVYEYVVIDMPPGVTDEQAFLCNRVPDAEVLIVTTSQNLALQEAHDTVQFFTSRRMRVLGVVENMSGFSCANCGTRTALFSSEGGRMLAEENEIEYLGSIEYLGGVMDGGDGDIKGDVEGDVDGDIDGGDGDVDVNDTADDQVPSADYNAGVKTISKMTGARNGRSGLSSTLQNIKNKIVEQRKTT